MAVYSEPVQALINDLRTFVADDDPTKNILDGKLQKYTDSKLHFFLRRALSDVNSTIPRTNFTFENYPLDDQDDLLILGAMVFMFMSEGILQLRNNVTYNDAGLSLDMFNKTGAYQQWAMFLAQQYEQGKREYKSTIIPSSLNAGFVGIRSQFHPHWGKW